VAVRLSRFVILAVACLALPHAASAQVPTPRVGERVRVVDVASGAPVYTGSLVRLAGDTVVISSGSAATTPVALGTARQLEVSQGMHPRTAQGMGIGLLVGAGVGAAIGFATYHKPDCGPQQFLCLDYGPGLPAVAGAAILGLSGLLIGAIAGSNSTAETWKPVDRSRIRVSLAPAAGGRVAFGGSIAF
jgi:hypothetical protein